MQDVSHTHQGVKDQGQFGEQPFRDGRDYASLACAVLGVVLNGLSYQSFEPHIVAAIFFVLGFLLFRAKPFGGAAEWRMFRRMFAVGFLMAGVSAIYVNQLRDFHQLYSDAGGFYVQSKTGLSNRLTLVQAMRITDGALMLYVWTPVYDFLEQWGIARGRFVGITINVFMVAVSAVAGIKMAKLLYGDDAYRLNRLILLTTFCGTFWLFASQHLRDASVLLVVSWLSYSFLSFVYKPSFGRPLLWLVLWIALSITLLEYLRSEMTFIPLPMILAAVFALRGRVQSKRIKRLATVFSVLGAIATLVGLAAVGSEIQYYLNRTNTVYEEQAEETEYRSGTTSLGLELIVHQPIPVRLIIGSAYAYLAPIPIWFGLDSTSAQFLYKSVNTALSYVLLPLMLTALWMIYRYKPLRIPTVLYIAATAVGFSMAVGITSMESRHLGAFFMLPLLLATVPDLRIAALRKVFRSLLMLMLLGMALIHVLWAIIKNV